MVLVTGGSGFMGRAIVRRLLASGTAVRVFDLVPPPVHYGPGAEFLAGSILDAPVVARAMAGVTAVVHLAAKVSDAGPRRAFAQLNVEGTRIVAEAAERAGARRMVHMSSVAVFDYRRGYDHADESSPAGGHEYPYGQTKWEAERWLRDRGGHALEVVILRPGLVPYGPGDQVSGRMMRALERGVPVLIDGGAARLSLSYIDNLVDAVMAALAHPAAAGETFHVADDDRLTWREFVAMMQAALGLRPVPRSLPRRFVMPLAGLVEASWRVVGRGTLPPLTRYRVRTATSDLHFGNAKARRVLGWVPKVAAPEGLAATVAWCRAGMPCG